MPAKKFFCKQQITTGNNPLLRDRDRDRMRTKKHNEIHTLMKLSII